MWVVQVDLISILGIEQYLIPMQDEVDIVVCRLSKKNHFSLVDRHRFVFCVVVENDWFLAPGSKSTGFLCRGIENDLILEWGSKLS